MIPIYWVRHGPTHEKAFVGWRDVPADLSDHAAIKRLSDYLPSDALVISSDLQRAVKTADAIEGNRERLPHDQHLREFDFGDWDGLHFSEVAERDPQLSRKFWEEPGDISPPGGESWNAVSKRVSAVVDRLLERGKPIIAVAHIGVIMTQIERAQGQGPYTAMGHKIDNLSVTEVRWSGGAWQLVEVNHNP